MDRTVVAPVDAGHFPLSVALPHSEFLDQAHIKTICTHVQFFEGATPGERCPLASIYGFARATTPLLDKPVEGPVYLRSSSHNLPDLVAALSGQIDVVLDGNICRKPQKATVKFTAQNGKTSDYRPLIGNSCKTKKSGPGHKKRGGRQG